MNVRDCLAASLTLLIHKDILKLDDVEREGKKGYDYLFDLINNQFGEKKIEVE